MRKQSEVNKAAWTYRTYEWWTKYNGTPKAASEEIVKNPQGWLQSHIEYLGNVNGKRIANLLGSNGRKAVPLALLGADVTIVDISEENERYALELAKYAGVKINYIVCDLFEIDMQKYNNYFDILYLEGGILHYFDDINKLSNILMGLLKNDGKLVLSDAHPIHKILCDNDGDLIMDGSYGNYFSNELVYGNVAYKTQFPESEQGDFPDCLLRYYTMGEIVTAIAQSGLIISTLIENPREDKYKNLPINFTLVAHKI